MLIWEIRKDYKIWKNRRKREQSKFINFILGVMFCQYCLNFVKRWKLVCRINCLRVACNIVKPFN